jgi:gas vesicle protein
MEERSGFGYFLLGLGLGVAAGVLWAPRSGDETRQMLADKAGEGADFLKSRAGDSADYVRSRADDGREYVSQRTEDLKNSAAGVYEQGRTVVNRQKENLNAAVEAGRQAYRDAVNDVKSAGDHSASAAASAASAARNAATAATNAASEYAKRDKGQG